MKIDVGADANSGLDHTVAVTAANEADVSQLPNLVREGDRAVFRGNGYVDYRLKRVGRKTGVFSGAPPRPKRALPWIKIRKSVR